MPLQATVATKRGLRGARPREVYVHIGVWHDPKTGHIHIAGPKERTLHSTVCNKANSKRYHPSLYRQLRQILVRNRRWA